MKAPRDICFAFSSSLISISLCLLAGFGNVAQASTTLYYVGTSRVLDMNTGGQSNEDVWLKKTMSPAEKLLVEIACIRRASQTPVLSPVYMKVDGNRITAISNTADFKGALSGTGELRGNAWDWSYLKFSMLWKFGEHEVRVEDGNFVVKNLLVARKQIFYDGNPSQLWDIEMKTVAPEEFAKLIEEAHCPEF